MTVNVTFPAGPVAVTDSGTTPFETPLVVGSPGVLDNDTGTGISVTSNTDPSDGTVTQNTERLVHLHARRRVHGHGLVHLRDHRRLRAHRHRRGGLDRGPFRPARRR